jgi:predicted DNA-binding transcriptional regulator YafY
MLEMLIMLGGKYGRTKSGLAQHFEISEKTVTRYFNTFKDAGFILEQNNKYWRINREDNNYKDLSQLLHFSQEESVVLRNAINSIHAPETIINELTHKLYSIYNFDRVATPLIRTHNENLIKKIEEAIKTEKQVILHNYSSSNSSTLSDRLVEAFDFTHNFRAVWCFDTDDKKCKIFVLSRIEDIKILDSNWKNKSKHKKIRPDIFRMTGKNQFNIELELSQRAKNLLIEEYPLSEQYIKPLKQNTYLLTTSVYSFDGVGRFIKGLLGEIKIIKPATLQENINKDLKKYLDNL